MCMYIGFDFTRLSIVSIVYIGRVLGGGGGGGEGVRGVLRGIFGCGLVPMVRESILGYIYRGAGIWGVYEHIS